ncbi:MAG: alpha/beta hydrolase [Dehalococcoidia bacterium]
MSPAFRRLVAGAVLGFAALAALGGCGEPPRGPIVFYLDGAGWYSSAGSVRRGLQEAGYTGKFETFNWSAYLGPAHDHLVTTKSRWVARRLSRKIEEVRENDPTGQINVMGLSAGTAVILSALEQLEKDVAVDNVVLFSPSVSARHDLEKAMRHVRRNLYATCSPHDGILSTLTINADGKRGSPAGRTGFQLPSRGTKTAAAYRRVINLPWLPSYVGFDWSGGHTSVTNPEFVAAVIAPRVLTGEPYPLDRSVMDKLLARRPGGGQ